MIQRWYRRLFCNYQGILFTSWLSTFLERYMVVVSYQTILNFCYDISLCSFKVTWMLTALRCMAYLLLGIVAFLPGMPMYIASVFILRLIQNLGSEVQIEKRYAYCCLSSWYQVYTTEDPELMHILAQKVTRLWSADWQEVCLLLSVSVYLLDHLHINKYIGVVYLSASELFLSCRVSAAIC